MKNGRVKWFSAERGFGFIESDGKDYFCHFKEIQKEGYKTLTPNELVSFTPGTSSKGAIATKVMNIS